MSYNRMIDGHNHSKQRFLRKQKPSLMKSENKRYGYWTDGPSGYQSEIFDSCIVGTLDWIKQHVDKGSILLWSVWWPNRTGVPITTARPENREYSKMLRDKYVHDQNIHDCKTGRRRRQAEEKKIPKNW